MSLSHSGSALRFSQPLSGFLASSSSTALFRAATVPGGPPSELSPRSDRVPLSRPLAPSQLSTSVPGCAPARPFASCFPDAHACTQLPGSPVDYGIPFHRPLGLASRFPWVPLGTHSFPVASPTSELCSPCESVRSAPANRERRPLLSWSSALLETFLRPWNLDPPLARPKARRQHAPAPESPGLATVRTSRPSLPGGASSAPGGAASVSSAGSDLLRDRSAPPLGGDSFSLDLSPQQSATVGLRSLEISEN